MWPTVQWLAGIYTRIDPQLDSDCVAAASQLKPNGSRLPKLPSPFPEGHFYDSESTTIKYLQCINHFVSQAPFPTKPHSLSTFIPFS